MGTTLDAMSNRRPEMYAIDRLLARALLLVEDKITTDLHNAEQHTHELIVVLFLVMRAAEESGVMPQLMGEIRQNSVARMRTREQALGYYVFGTRPGRYRRGTRAFTIAGLETLNRRPDMATATEPQLLAFLRTHEGGLDAMQDNRVRERATEAEGRAQAIVRARRTRADSALATAADAAGLPIEDYVAAETRRRLVTDTQGKLRQINEVMPLLIAEGLVERMPVNRRPPGQGVFIAHANRFYRLI